MAAPVRGPRARALQVVGAICVSIGVFLAVVMWAAFHAPSAVRLGIGLAVVGVVLLVLAAIARRIQLFRR